MHEQKKGVSNRIFTTYINIKGLERLNQGATSITDADDYNYWLIKI